MAWYKDSRKHSLCAKGIKTGRRYNRLRAGRRKRLEALNFDIADPDGILFPNPVRYNKKNKKEAPIAYAHITNVMRKHPEIISDLERTKPNKITYYSEPASDGVLGSAYRSQTIWVKPRKEVNPIMVKGKDGEYHQKLRPSTTKRTADTFIHENTHLIQQQRGDSKLMDEWNKKVPYDDRPHEVEARNRAYLKLNKPWDTKYPTGKEISNTLGLETDSSSYVTTDWGKGDELSRDERINKALENIHKKRKK